MFHLLSLGNALESSMGGGGVVKEWRGDTSLQSEGQGGRGEGMEGGYFLTI